MPYRTPEDLGVPVHDPVADEQDLLTIPEAAARLHDELVEARERLAAAQSSPDPVSVERVDALRGRVEALETGLERYDRLRRARAVRR
ncbi:hypothetical protein GCM10009836_34200 [Pseudonocardia ailaonensis]|uniref:Uncharacterized protein n=1 Tax=Pseudonocardia ailaonensis TaxID=367279 RepID=A0ABN2N3T8_9PSEU